MASRPVLPERDWESMPAEEVLGELVQAFPGRVSLACSFQKEERVLLDLLLASRPTRASSRSTRTSSSRRPTSTGARSSSATARGRDLRGADARPAGRGARRQAVGANPTCAARSARSSRSARPRRLDAGSPASAATSRRPAPTRPRSAGTSAHELWKANPLADWTDERLLGVHPRARPALQRAARGATPRSAARTARARRRSRGRWSGNDQDRVRPARRRMSAS